MKRNLVVGLIFVSLTLFLTGCCGGGKEKADTVVVPPPTTVIVPQATSGGVTAGQQLQDLKAAQDQGAITEEEFEASKEKILKAE